MNNGNSCIILCDGGFGNRINSLLGGLCVTEMLNTTPIICWPKNNWCDCSFSDLFQKDLNMVIDCGINELFQNHLNDAFLIHENQTNFHLNFVVPITQQNVIALSEQHKNIIYYNSLIPHFCSKENTLSKLRHLTINSEIVKYCDDFALKHNISKDVSGIHLRGTDLKDINNIKFWTQYVKDNDSKVFFVCSDELEIELLFKNYSNVILNKKTEYVTKLINGNWNETIQDNQGRTFNFNVNRSSQSVKEAFADMLILAKTNILSENHSTFLNVAKMYNLL